MKTIKIFLMLIMLSLVAMPMNAEYKRQGNVIVKTKVDTTKNKTSEPAVVVGTVVDEVSGKSYPLYRGPKGGYFYYNEKVDKKGKPVKVYLSKKDKAALGLK